MVDQFGEEKIAYLPASGNENWLRFSFYCSESKILKNRSKQNSNHACNFIHNRKERKCSVWSI